MCFAIFTNASNPFLNNVQDVSSLIFLSASCNLAHDCVVKKEQSSVDSFVTMPQVQSSG